MAGESVTVLSPSRLRGGEETALRSAFQRKRWAVGEGQELAPALVVPSTEQASAPHLSLIPRRCRGSGDILSPRSARGEEKTRQPQTLSQLTEHPHG